MLCTTAARTHRDDCFKPICLGQKAVYNYELWLGLRPKKETKNQNVGCIDTLMIPKRVSGNFMNVFGRYKGMHTF